MVSKKDRRKSILRAALKIFSKNGFYKSKMEVIAKEAGIGKGTLYEYFNSKKHLFQESIKESMLIYKEDAKRAFLTDGKIEEKLEAFFNFHGEFLSKHKDIFYSFMTQSNSMSEEMEKWMIEVKIETIEVILNSIQQSIDSGEFREDLDVELATFMIIGTVTQYYGKKMMYDNTDYRKIDTKLIIDTLSKGLKAC